MKERFQKFMYGRYGTDDFGKFISIASFILIIIGMVSGTQLSWIGLALIIYSYFRIFSRNTEARSKENYAYLRVLIKIKGWFKFQKMRFKERNSFKFFKCPTCKMKLRVPKGKGKITISCPKCSTKFTKMS